MALAQTEDAASTLTRETKNQTKRVASRAQARSRQVARSTAGEGRAVASHAREEAQLVLDEAAGQARRTVTDTLEVVEQQTAAQLDRLATQLQQLVAEANALAAGHPDEAERLRDLVGEAAEKLDLFADRVQNLGADIEADGLGVALRDLQDFARRRPGAFLLGALGGGFLVGRMVRSDQDGDSADAGARARRTR